MNEVRNVLVGFVLGQNESQISYYDRRAGEPVQVPTKLGTNLFGFPTALAKVPGKDEWHFGHEAALAAKEKGAELIPSLYQCWCGEEPVTVDGEEHTPGNLLAIYLRRSLALLGLRDILRSISFMMFTTEVLSEGFVRNLRAALKEIGFSQEQCGMQDFKESFYYYTYHQTEDFFQANVALFLFERDRVVPLILSEDRQVRPRAVTIVQGPGTELPEEKTARDEAFLACAKAAFQERKVSGVFLSGEGFDQDWAERSLPFLLGARRRVFYGDNLFVKGACYAAVERKEQRSFRNRQYMSEATVRTGVGMDLLLSGSPSYYPMINSGINWFEAEASCEILLDGRDFLLFSLRSMDGKKRTSRQMDLPGLPARPGFITRLRLRLRCLSPEICEVTAEDLGFGGFFPATHKVWREELELAP